MFVSVTACYKAPKNGLVLALFSSAPAMFSTSMLTLSAARYSALPSASFCSPSRTQLSA